MKVDNMTRGTHTSKCNEIITYPTENLYDDYKYM